MMSDLTVQKVPPTRTGLGFMVALVATVVLTALASVAPSAIHKLILFSIAYGACVGAVVAWTLREFGMSRLVGFSLSILLIACGCTAIAGFRHQQLRHEAQSAARKDADQMLALNMLKAAAEDDPEIAADYERHRRQINPTFTDYLAVRVRPLGEWEPPWPSVFWAAEVILAMVTGLFLFWKLSGRGLESGVQNSVLQDEGTAHS